MEARLQCHASRCESVCKVSRTLSSHAAANTVSCPGCAPFSGFRIFRLKCADMRSALLSCALAAVVCGFVLVGEVRAQNRGVYPLGMSATNSGVTPEPGFSYVNQLLIYSRDKSKGPNGEILATGSNSVVMDMNTLAWVSKKKILGGAKFSMTATLPVARNSLTSDFTGPVSGGGGFA